LFEILKTWASSDVRDSSIYLLFYMVLGAAWIGLALRCTGFAGISVRDDAIERRNGAASLALAGSLIGLTLAFAGGNIGDGPGCWVVVFAAGLATLVFFALWIALDAFAHVSDAITIDRDLAMGVRLAGFLTAEGIILGRAVAGDWVSAAATLRDFVIAGGWPSLMLLVAAIGIEHACRPTLHRPTPRLAMFGITPALVYVMAAMAIVFVLGMPA
jgi:hypothetical protein